MFILSTIFVYMLTNSLGSLVSADPRNDAGKENTNEWSLKKEKEGIKVYTRLVEGSPYKEFKGVILLDTSLVSVLGLLDDVAACEDWIHRCKLGKTLEEIHTDEKYERLIYQVTRLPFPLKNRDAIYRASVSWGSENTSAKIELASEPQTIEKTDYIRVVNSWGQYLVSTTDDEKVQLTWIHYADPGGILPAFLVNSMSVNIPFKSLRNFRKRVMKDEYQNLEFQYNTKGGILGFNPINQDTQIKEIESE